MTVSKQLVLVCEPRQSNDVTIKPLGGDTDPADPLLPLLSAADSCGQRYYGAEYLRLWMDG